MAIDLAETRKAQLHVVCVAEMLHAPLFMSEVDEAVENAMSEAQSVLAEATAWAQTRNIAIRGHALTGSPTRAIVALASAVDAQLLVIGRSKRSSLSRRLFGSAADGILSMARCSVVVAA
ncbi:universal stress protein [Methylocystis rosea]